MTAYDVTRELPGQVVTTHHEGKVETDGPWLILYPPGENAPNPELIVPAHVVFAVTECEGRCRGGGE